MGGTRNPSLLYKTLRRSHTVNFHKSRHSGVVITCASFAHFADVAVVVAVAAVVVVAVGSTCVCRRAG